VTVRMVIRGKLYAGNGRTIIGPGKAGRLVKGHADREL